MSGMEVLAVVACVAAIVSAYNDGAELVKRIKAKREAKRRALADQATHGLEVSLARGPPAVQTQYDSNFRRFGAQYEQGDQIAREQMKDIIINLQMALLRNLRMASEDDVEVNFIALQIASDDSQVNAIMALCQLYQRMAVAAPILTGPSPMSIPGARDPQSMTQFSSSPTDQRLSFASTPPSLINYSMQMSTSPSDNHTGSSPVESQSQIIGQRRNVSLSSSPGSKRRSFLSSLLHSNSRHSNSMGHTSSRSGQPPIAPVNEAEVEEDGRFVNSVRRNDTLSMLQMQTQSENNQTAKVKHHSSHPSKGNADQFLSLEEDVNPWTQDDSDEDQDIFPHSSGHAIPSGSSHVWADDSQDLPFHDGGPPPKGNISFHNTSPTIPRGYTASHRSANSSLSGTMAVSSGMSMTLYLPCEENGFAGFCKGAWKLQIGVKKAFKPESRPAGMYNDIPFWRCSKCSYEGPMAGGVTKSTRVYDSRVRIHQDTGIQYRWAFLAKSHVAMRKIPTGTDGSVGIFGCIFCCAERKAPSENFGNLSIFMHHLLQHRHVVPGMEALLDRTRCILGRVAHQEEDFDINIPPET
ncbi:predicted protein [Paecilomyces variotii No. 5]|uniref:Uncharacterized protein n=1 Tax=Byssochlamys spectabilis (strain No. 5 / NBRC 109023) TaxID=1356009 RepID=V5FT75_BYSSN|nr:predicted protein [Paecilomyces variotii No. 5]